jgi:hypothetical protein
MPWLAVIVFAAFATAAVVVVGDYIKRNREIQAAAEAARADTPLTLPQPEVEPEFDGAQTDSWIWR